MNRYPSSAPPPLPWDMERTLVDIVSASRLAAGYGINDDWTRRSGVRRESSSYRARRLEHWRILLYKSRADRVVLAASGLLVLSVTMTTLVYPAAANARGVAVAVMLSTLPLFLAVESGRRGYLDRQTANRVDDLASSLAVSVVRGHHRVHEAEQELVSRAERGEDSKLLVVDLWSQARPEPRSSEFTHLQRMIDDFAHTRGHSCRTAVFINATDRAFYLDKVLQHREGDVEVYKTNPLQCDAMLTNDEVIISFPRRNSNRSFALRFRNEAVVAEFWDVFTSQVGPRTASTSMTVEGKREAGFVD